MLTVEEIIKRLEDREIKQVALNIGVHPNTIYRIVWGLSKSPSHRIVKLLSDYLTGGDACN